MAAVYPHLFPGKHIQEPTQLYVEGLNDLPWYLPIATNPFESGREEFGLAWMLDNEVIVKDALKQTPATPHPFYEIPWAVSYEQYKQLFQQANPSKETGDCSTTSLSGWLDLHRVIAEVLNDHCHTTGTLVWNVSPYVLNSPSFDRFALSADVLYAHAGLLLALNHRLLRLLPYISLPTFAPGLKSRMHDLQPYILATTKGLVRTLRTQQIRTPVTLQSDLTKFPVEIRSHAFNRLAARRERLVTLPEKATPAGIHPRVPSRLEASMTGAVLSTVGRIHASTLRIGYIHPSHGGQRRAFHVRFEGEGGIDNGGLYRELFSSVMQELHDPELFPFLVRTPNHLQADADLGKEDFLLNPAVLEMEEWNGANVLENLGRLVGTAVMSGIQLDLFLSLCVWKLVVGEPLELADLKRIDLARWKIYSQMLVCDVSRESAGSKT